MPRLQTRSFDLIPRDAEQRTTVHRADPPTVAVCGHDGGNSGVRAELLVRDEVVDVRDLYRRVDRGRIAEQFEGIRMNLLESEGQFWGLLTPWHTDDLEARQEKKSR